MLNPYWESVLDAREQTRRDMEAAILVDEFSVVVHGATSPDGASAVMLGLFPPSQRGWMFPMPIGEARRVAAMLIEVADEKEQT